MKLFDDVYVYPWLSMQENNTNTIFIDGEVPTLIDPGHSHLFSHVVEGMAADGIDVRRVKMVIGTHGHPDHIEAIERFDEEDVILAIGKQEFEYLQGEGKELFIMTGTHAPHRPFKVLLKEGPLSLGKKRFEVIVTPGHSPGSLCLYWQEKRVLISGDTLFYMGVGRTDLSGGSLDRLLQSLGRLSKLKIEYLLPGHGEMVKGQKTIEKNFEIIFSEFFR